VELELKMTALAQQNAEHLKTIKDLESQLSQVRLRFTQQQVDLQRSIEQD
jgi:hypothetical protein